jgi:Lrp/AsnC family leucine-responsive transcriptional regulator
MPDLLERRKDLIIMIDQTDNEIIRLLSENSRMQWQEIGERVHLTGQAVRNRISRLEKLGIIEGYTVRLDYEKLGICVTAYVTLFMKTTDHAAFKKYIAGNPLVKDAHRISGEGCYILKVEAADRQSLNDFLDEILEFGNYRLNMSIDKIK